MLIVIEDATAAAEKSTASRTTGLSPDIDFRLHTWESAPARNDVRAALEDADASGVLVFGSLAGLNAVVEGLRRADRLTDVPIAFVASKRADLLTLDFADLLRLPRTAADALASEPVALQLARNDVGGVMLQEASFFSAEPVGRFAAPPNIGTQTYHDDQLIADGIVRRIDVRIDYAAQNQLLATVTPTSGRKPISTSTGRAVQLATDECAMVVDGKLPVDVEGRTWYVDDREHWLLRGAQPPSSSPRSVTEEPQQRRGWFRRR